MNAKKKTGRPLKFKTVADLQKKIEAYFKACDKKQIPLTITGLAIALNTSRQTLVNYEEKEEFFDTIKKAKSIIENHIETMALTGKYVPVISIFNLKNNFGWKDKTELDHSSSDGSMSPAKVLDTSKISTEALREIVAALKNADSQ